MTTPPQLNRWVRQFHAAPTARTRLVCFPHAGGSASYYFPLSAALRGEFDVYALQYPGRQDRYAEPFVESIEDMADQAFAALQPLIDAPMALFGHSMGAVLAFEVARRLESVAGRQAVMVFASGARAPSRFGDEPAYKTDAELIEVMRELGGTDPRVLDDPELRAMFVAPFFNDFRALQPYRRGTDTGITAPITVLAAVDDHKTSVDDARAWLDHTAGGGDVHTFAGGHFFLEKEPQRVIQVVAEALRSAEGR